MTITDAIKPCPFCGAASTVMTEGINGPFRVYCNNDGTWGDDGPTPCNAEGPERATAPEAVSAWNNREAAEARAHEEGAKAMQWRDIATAPRDDNSDMPVILFNGHRVTAGFSWENGWADCWYDWMDPQPTHWQPLPEPPALDPAQIREAGK